jgi:hypothetical protein
MESYDRNELKFPYRRNKINHPISNNSDRINDSNKNSTFPREIMLHERSKIFSLENPKNENNNFNIDNNQSNINENINNNFNNENNIPKINENNLNLENSFDNDYVVFLAENFKLQILNKLDKKNNLFSNKDYIYSKIYDLFNVNKIISLRNFNTHIMEILKSFDNENFEDSEDFVYFGPLDIIKYNQNISSLEEYNEIGIGNAPINGPGIVSPITGMKRIQSGLSIKYEEKSSINNDNKPSESIKSNRDFFDYNNEFKAENSSLFKKDIKLDNNINKINNDNKINEESYPLRENNNNRNNINNNNSNNLEKESFMIREKFSNRSNEEQKEKNEIGELNKESNDDSNRELDRIIDVPHEENLYDEKKINNIDNELKNLRSNSKSKTSDENLFQKYLINNLEKLRRVNFYCFKINEELNNTKYEKFINEHYKKQDLNSNSNPNSNNVSNSNKSNNYQENFELKSISELNSKSNIKSLRNRNNNINLLEKKINKKELKYDFSDKIIDNDNSRSILNHKHLELIEVKDIKDAKNDIINIENNDNNNDNKNIKKNKQSIYNKFWNLLKNLVKCKIFQSEKKHVVKKYIFAIEEVMFNFPINDNYIFEEIKLNNNNIYDNFMSSENLYNFNTNKRSSITNLENYCDHDQLKEKEYCPLSFDLNFDNPLKPYEYSNQLKKSTIIKKNYSNSYDYKRLSKIKEEKESFDTISYRNPKSKIYDRIVKRELKSKSKLFSVKRNKTNINKSPANEDIEKTYKNCIRILNNSDPCLLKKDTKLRLEIIHKECDDSVIELSSEISDPKILSEHDLQRINDKNFIDNLSALMHDFKHVVYDNMIFFDFLVMKYIHPIIAINNKLTKDNSNNFSNPNDNHNKDKDKDNFEIKINNELSENKEHKKSETFFKEFGKSEDLQIINSLILNNQNSNPYNSNSNSSPFSNSNPNSNSNSNPISNSNSSGGSIKLNPKDLFLIYKFILKLDSEKIKDDLIYLNVMKDYTTSMILNITNFMSNNNFLIGSSEELIDIIYISNVMVKIFNRRLEYENALIDDVSLRKKISIRAKFVDLEILRKLKINSNKNMMISLIYNIMSNSYKYTKLGEIEIQVRSIIVNRKNFVELKISDSGSGIPKEIIKNWGQAFNLNDNDKGTGLGQYLINTISMRLNVKLMKPQNKVFPQNGTIIGILIPVLDEPFSKKNPYETFNSNSNVTIVNKSIDLNPDINFDIYSNEKSNVISISGSYSEMFNEEKIKNELSGNSKKIINSKNENNNIKNSNSDKGNINDNANMNKQLKNLNLSQQNEKNEKLQEDNNNNLNISKNQLSLSSRKILNIEAMKKSYVKKKKLFTIICLDDDPVFLSLLGNNLRRWTSSVTDCKFNLIFTDTFTNFFKEFYSLIENDIIPDFFIMDQNISPSIKGVECCQLINEFYKIYLKDEYMKNDFTFFFFTEESNMMNYKIMKKDINILKKQHIFGKLQVTELISIMEEKMGIKN